MNVLTDPVFTVETSGEWESVSLPEVFAHLEQDDIDSFPGLAQHQYEPWHQFLVQLGAIAMTESGSNWTERLLNQAPMHAWALEHSDLDKPAFLQPSQDGGEYKPAGDDLPGGSPLAAYDLCMTKKGHGRKRAQQGELTPEEEVYILLGIQTAGRYGGRGHASPYRTNGSRPFFSLTDSLRPGPWVMREITRMNDLADQIAETYDYASDVHPLLWIVPWEPIDRSLLHPLFIDCARQLRKIDGTWHYIDYLKNGDRIEGEDSIATGDYWTPIQDAETFKVKDRTFGYQDLHKILFTSEDVKLPPSFDPNLDEGWIVVSGLISGTRGDQGSSFTSYRKRVIRFSADMYNQEAVAQESERRYQASRDAEAVLRVMLNEGGVEKPDNWYNRLRCGIDQIFFDDLYDMASKPLDTRQEWDQDLLDVLNAVADDLRCHIKTHSSSSARYWEQIANATRGRQNVTRARFPYLVSIDS